MKNLFTFAKKSNVQSHKAIHFIVEHGVYSIFVEDNGTITEIKDNGEYFTCPIKACETVIRLLQKPEYIMPKMYHQEFKSAFNVAKMKLSQYTSEEDELEEVWKKCGWITLR